jgi:hypothetical protein
MTEKLTRENPKLEPLLGYEKSPSSKKTQIRAVVITREKPIVQGTTKATTITAPLIRDATNTNQPHFLCAGTDNISHIPSAMFYTTQSNNNNNNNNNNNTKHLTWEVTLPVAKMGNAE